jgi:hypothetical protein
LCLLPLARQQEEKLGHVIWKGGELGKQELGARLLSIWVTEERTVKHTSLEPATASSATRDLVGEAEVQGQG